MLDRIANLCVLYSNGPIVIEMGTRQASQLQNTMAKHNFYRYQRIETKYTSEKRPLIISVFFTPDMLKKYDYDPKKFIKLEGSSEPKTSRGVIEAFPPPKKDSIFIDFFSGVGLGISAAAAKGYNVYCNEFCKERLDKGITKANKAIYENSLLGKQ